MIASRSLFAVLLASASLTACVLDGADDPEVLGEADSNLSSASWTSPGWKLEDLGASPAMTIINGAELYVFPWEDGSSVLPGVSHDLYWVRCDSGGGCTSPKRVPDQESLGRVNLATFNGKAYMVHQGDSDSTAVWFSRFDPYAGTWTSNVKLSFATFGGAPALAVFNNRLYIAGSLKRIVTRNNVATATYPLWYATMDANETFSATATIAGEESASPPSLAALDNRLYVAHRWGQTSQIVIQSTGLTGPWSAVQHIPAGPSNASIEGDDVQIAAVNGYLHLVHHRWSGNQTWWTYNRGCDAFAPEISVPSYNFGTKSSMQTGFGGLKLNGMVDSGLWPYTHNNWYQSKFNAPPAPLTVPRCSLVFSGGGGGVVLSDF
ncbi:MAG: hypothetical protein ABJE66_16230 [Deltaproteobacteria bacterium]